MPQIVARSVAHRPAARRVRTAASALAAALVALPAQADDIDVYTAQLPAQRKPNVLFVLDFSGSMNEDASGGSASSSGEPRKIDTLREVMVDVLNDPQNVGSIRAGIGSIYDSTPSGVRWPISDLDADANDIDPAIPDGAFTAREVMLKQLDRVGAGGDTRTVNALVEAAMYFRGGPVVNGGRATNRPWEHKPDVWNVAAERYQGGNPRAAIAASYAPSNAYWRNVFEAGNFGYCTDRSASGGSDGCAGKVTYDCETRDGGTWSGEGGAGGTYSGYTRCRYEHPDAWRGASYESPIGHTCEANAIVLISDGLPDPAHDNDSLREVIGTPASECEDLDQSIFADVAGEEWNGNCGPEVVRALHENPQIPDMPGSTVKTYTVGFGIDGIGKNFLDRLASEGGTTRSYSAASKRELKSALRGIFDDIDARSQSFVEVAIGVDKASFSHDDRAFVSLFAPSRERAWSGNLKGYFVGENGLVDTNGAAAVTADGTAFVDDAQSFWSRTSDGNSVAAGGASALLATGGRTLYTWLGDPGTLGPNGADLSLAAEHRLRPDNGAITAEHLGPSTSEDARTRALEWLQSAPMGDPLHSKSVGVDYGDTQVVYVMTNQGLLHAIDASEPTAPGVPGEPDTATHTGGEELFAFMPKRLLRNLPILAGESREGPHVYGLDGAITRWHTDANNDGIVNGDDELLLILGMRRGGEAYYALDVTDPDRPTLRWVIDSETSGFAELAQSWSRMSLVRARVDGAAVRVLMFGGGYDAEKLDGEDDAKDSRGNAIFVVDRDGALLRKFGKDDDSNMSHAIAADLTVIDSDADGLADRIYAGDLGGQLWRVDFDDLAVAEEGSVTRLADLDDGGHQPFFYPPSVALNRRADGDFLSVALGSGNRTEPLDESSRNAFFMIRDTDVAKGPPAEDFETATADDLVDVEGDAADAPAAPRGWRLALAPGEKSLSRVVSFEGQLLATTFVPGASPPTDECGVGSAGSGRFYRMDIGDAAPIEHGSDEEDGEAPVGRWREIGGDDIPSAPQVIFPKGSSEARILVGRELVDTIEQRLTRVYWHAK